MGNNIGQFYDDDAKEFDYGRPTLYYRRVLFSLISKKIPKTASVLDVGCATGWMLKALDNGTRELTGIDNSKEMIARNHSYNIIEADCRKFSTISKYDVAIISNVLHHFNKEDREIIMDNVLASVNNECQIFIVTPNIFSSLILMYIYRRFNKIYGPRLKNIMQTPHHIKEILHQNTLQISSRFFYASPVLISLGLESIEKLETNLSLPSGGYILIEGRKN